MTLEEIQSELNALVAAMVEKGIKQPDANYTLRANAEIYVTLWCAIDGRQFDGEYLKNLPSLAAARAYIAAMPDADKAALHQYMRKAGELVDFGREHNIPDEYVVPVRTTIKAMSDNLLTGPKVAAE